VTAALVAAVAVALPSPVQPLSPQPPLGSAPITETEGIFHRVDAATRVRVRVDRSGRPFAVGATHRLAVRDPGDYAFVVPAPVLDVRAAAGSQSVPGQRRGAIVWAGFNPSRKVLAANATLDPRAAGRELPLRIEVGPSTITLVNATPITAGVFTAEAVAPPLARYLDRVRAAALAGRAIPPGVADLTTMARPAHTTVEAPLRVTGTVGGRRVDTVLGDGRPLRVTLRRGDGRVALRVEPVAPTRLLTPPGRSWAEAGLGGRALLARTNGALLRLARVRQYDAFLANPDPRGPATATFVYRTGRPAAATAPPVATDESSSALTTALVVAATLAALAAGVVVWARS
jgi:hypothetical protein